MNTTPIDISGESDGMSLIVSNRPVIFSGVGEIAALNDSESGLFSYAGCLF
jgi:hypothetical protein